MSIIFAEKTNDIITVDDDFAVLKKVSLNGDMTFEVFFKISKSKAVQTNTLKVDIEVSTQNIRRTSVTLNGKATASQIIGNILRNTHNIYNASLAKKNYVVANVSADVTAYIDNTKIKAAAAGQQSKKNVIKYEAAKNIKARNENTPVFQQLAYKSFSDIAGYVSGTLTQDPAELAQKILASGLDPSSIIDLTHRSLAASDTIQGLSRKTRVNETGFEPISQLLDFHVIGANALNIAKSTQQIEDDEVQLTAQAVDDDVITVSQEFTIEAFKDNFDARDITQCFVSFSALNAQKITKILNIQTHLTIFSRAEKRPSVKTIKLPQKILLDIKQNDEFADSIVVYKKTIYDSVPSTKSFTIFGKYALPYGKNIKIESDLSNENTDIYRVFPAVSDIVSNIFSSAVVLPKNQKINRIIPITTTNISDGISIALNSIPKEIISIQLLSKNLTLFQKNFTAAQDPLFINESDRTLKNLNLTDSSVIKNMTYMYVIQMMTATGRSSYTESSIITYKGTTSDRVTTVLSGTVVSSNPIDVSFKINTSVVPESSDLTLSLLKQAGTYDLFQTDFSGSRSSLQDLLAHSVERVNKTTGLRENFGVVADGYFSDAKLQRANSVLPLAPGNSYRYEVFVLMRSPETLLKNYTKEAIDSRTKRAYRFDPVKFFHPVVSAEGMLVTSDGLKVGYPQNDMEHGNIGLSTAYEVSFDIASSQVSAVNAIKSTRNTNTVTWQVTGDTQTIDHYLIMKEVHGIRTMLEAVYAPYATISYTHQLSHKDNGPIKYVIVAVYSDYEVGPAVYSNSLIVDL